MRLPTEASTTRSVRTTGGSSREHCPGGSGTPSPVQSSQAERCRPPARDPGDGIGWFAASFVVGTATGSLALIAFGLNAAVDSLASATLVWRFGQERKHAERGDQVERIALRVVGATLVAIALYVGAQGIRSLLTRSHPDGSAFGVGLAAASLLVLPLLAYGKLKLANVVGSRALRGDGLLTGAGALLALVAPLGQLLNEALGWWWSDSVAALVIGLGLFVEGWRSLRPTHSVK